MCKKLQKAINPEETCSYLNKITFQWFHKLAATGNRRALEISDLWSLRAHDETENLVPKFNKHWIPAIQCKPFLASL